MKRSAFLSHPSSRWAVVVLMMISFLGGCHRQYYRRQADMEAHQLIDQKVVEGRQDPGKPLRIQMDPRSRMFNPFDLDFQPMPLDDPDSHRFMHCVDGRKGYPLWHAAGTTNTSENPQWWQYLPLDEDGVLRLNSDTAVQLALLHSPDYQQQVETLYLSALDVSSERFRFDTQFFGGARAFLTADGRDRPGAGGESSTTFEIGPSSVGRRPWALQRSFAWGGDLVVGFANSVVWELSGPNTQSASTIFDFALLQPLLRNAGRDRVLERLTLAERRLLSNVRAFERYRRSFYLFITMGRQTESQVRRSGGVFGVGLGGFTGLGGGFAGLGGGGGGGGGGFGVTGGGGVPQAGGFLGLLQNQLQIRNVEENIARLSENQLILEDTLIELLTTIPEDAEAIPRQRLQIAQAQSALLNAQSQLISRKADYQNSLDDFLTDLGLPPYLCVKIEDPMLDRFELIDETLRGRREELIRLRTAAGDINLSLLESASTTVDPATGLPRTSIAWTPQLGRRIAELRQSLQPLLDFRRQLVEVDMPRVANDLDVLDQAIDARREQAEELKAAFRADKQQICTLLDLSKVDENTFSGDKVGELAVELRYNFKKLGERLAGYTKKIDDLAATLGRFSGDRPPAGLTDEQLAAAIRDEVILATQDILTEVADDVLSLQLIQARSRTESVLLPEIDLDQRTAFEIAQANRPDLANARAALVDSWRLIEFNADDLESSLDVVFSGDIQNVGDNPLDLRSSTGRLRAGLQWDAPLTRLQERNTYRQSLIEFDQARRSYYRFEDSLWQVLRGQLRQVLTNQINFEFGRQSVRIAAEQLELNEDIRAFRDARALSSGPTAARDTISALSDLLNSQNTLLNIFVNYEVIRRSLDFDLGTMQITPDGMWIDPGPLTPETLVGGVRYSTSGGMIDGSINEPCLSCGVSGDELYEGPMLDGVVPNGNVAPVFVPDGTPL
ncbi:MAG: hypothetical protein ACO1RT_16575 [Planctomycetaceae bacterium]